MSNAFIEKRFSGLNFGTWKWEKQDYKTPLVFQLQGAQSRVYIEEPFTFGAAERLEFPINPLQLVMNLIFVLVLENASPQLVRALRSKGDPSVEIAKRVYDYFLQTMTQLEGVLRTAGRVRNLMSLGIPSIHGFFDSRSDALGEQVTWRLDDGKRQEFLPKIRGVARGKFALYKHPQLMTTEKWRRLQHDL